MSARPEEGYSLSALVFGRAISHHARRREFVLCNWMCDYSHMATNLQIDNDLIQEALDLGGHRSKRAVVEAALREYVQRRKQLKIMELFGTVEYDEDYDYKRQRRKR